MNELRMYVERLFEGKVLTAENIELKEEIYGNLVARYEDLVDGDMDAAEALERTKASFTSVDDVLGDEGVEAGVAVDGENAVETGADQTTQIPPVDPTVEMPDTQTAKEARSEGVEGIPVPPADAASNPVTPVEQGPKRGKVWPWACGGCLVLLIVIPVFSMLLFGANVLVDQWGNDAPDVDTQANIASGTGDAQLLDPDDTGVTVDPNGPVYLDGEPADELLQTVVDSSYNDVMPYADSSFDDVDSIDALIFNLPMGQWATNLDLTRGNGVLRFDYVGVPDYYDGDSIDMALAYNITALFCAVPEANKIQLTISESDEVNDHDCHVFERAAIEEMYGVPLNTDMVNEAGWKQLKNDNLYRHDFAEHMVDFAESEGR